jgi:sporulation protein YqfC
MVIDPFFGAGQVHTLYTAGTAKGGPSVANKRDLRDKVASLFELPGDVMLDGSRISLVGAKEMLVENHRGIHEYTTDRVVLAVPEGKLAIAGSNLTIGSISPDQVTILGSIRAIQYGD